MITRKLSKPQGYTIQGLVTQLNQLQVQANDIQAALGEQAELLRIRYELPEGDTQFMQGPDGWELRVTPAPVVPAEPPGPGDVPVQDSDEDGDVIEPPIRAGKVPGPSETKAAEDA